ncbi:MAG TPA: hypothetical protein PKV16_04765 [Caldisericia bacterium]|nr:hypothetical protein [Caldisericia bacterium]HPF48623.1 hypothetical protein [Caldisericia bacterium]HPI83717.1 hypothetical protein [Caldisericia bacterium]HPQ93078.1 hypothetical protein [Caldisericia bacterium]HRV75089.1 hypothetical protein [Caldisericia bacterium]
MTIEEKLYAYEQAANLLNSIPEYPWPRMTLAMSYNGSSDKTDGNIAIHTWYSIDSGWQVIMTETWTEGTEKKSNRETSQELTSAQAAELIEGYM